MTRAVRLLGLLSLLVPALASAQTSELRTGRGVALPPTSPALIDDAAAVQLNPAGLALLEKPQLLYLHERTLASTRTTDALFVGTGLFGWGGVGVGVSWLRPATGPSLRRTAASLALGGRLLSLGLTFNSVAAPEDRSGQVAEGAHTGWDAGLTFHPWRFLSIAATAQDFDGPRTGVATTAPRRFTLGIAGRPGADRVSLAADLLVDDQTGFDGARLNFAARVEPLEGLVVSGGFAMGLDGKDLMGQVALTLNTGHFGATFAGGMVGDLQHWHTVTQVRASMDRVRGLPFYRDQLLVVDVPALVAKKEGGLLQQLVAPSSREPYLELLSLLERARRTPEVAGVLLKLGELSGVGAARIEELRQEFLRTRAAGKHVYAIFLGGGDAEYLLATAAERIWTVPQATFLLNGYSVTSNYLAGALANLGVRVDVAKVGSHKTAPDTWTRTEMTPEEREMLDAWLDGLSGRMARAVDQSRGVKPERLAEAQARGVLTASMAKEAGLVDQVLYPDELPGVLREAAGRDLDLVGELPARVASPPRWGTRPKIALINLEGMIAEGKDRSDLFGLTRIAGAETALRSLDAAARDPSIRAIVLRVDSSGGSGAASDLLWRAVRKVREVKPLVAVMGDYAASGGYYVAMGAERVFAEPSTLTGSIGVFALKPDLSGLLEKLGVKQQTVRRGEHADLLSLTRPWSASEQQAMQAYMDEFYDLFITRVAECRKLDKAAVDAVGRGRVFSGEAALQHKLVDELGGVREALAWVQERAGLGGEEYDLEVLRERGGLLDLDLGDQGAEALHRVGRTLGEPAGALGVALELPEGPLALLPFRLSVR